MLVASNLRPKVVPHGPRLLPHLIRRAALEEAGGWAECCVT